MAVRNVTLVSRTFTGTRRAYVQWRQTDRTIVDTACTLRQYADQNFDPVSPSVGAVWFHAGITESWDRGPEDSGLFGDAVEDRGNVHICLSDSFRQDCDYTEERDTTRKEIERAGGHLSLTPDEYTGTFPAITITNPPPGITCVAGVLDIDDDVATKERHDDSVRGAGHRSVAQTAVASGTFTNTTSDTLNTTATGTNRGAFAACCTLDSVDSGPLDSVTYDSVNMTERAHVGGTSRSANLWSLGGPSTTASAAVVFDYEGTNAFSRVWDYVETTDDTDATTEFTDTDTYTSASTNAISMTVTTATGERCLGVYYSNNTEAHTHGADETEEYNNSSQAKRVSIVSQAGVDGGALDCSWTTATIGRGVAISIKQAAAAGGSLPPVPSHRAPIRAQTM